MAVQVTRVGQHHPRGPGPAGIGHPLGYVDHPGGHHRPRCRPAVRGGSGDKVTITLPNNQTTPGTVSSVGTVATTPSWRRRLVQPDHHRARHPDRPCGHREVGPGAGRGHDHHWCRVTDALVVPVDALLALAGGGYAVEEVSARRAHSLEPVSLGLFDDADGLVQVTRPGRRGRPARRACPRYERSDRASRSAAEDVTTVVAATSPDDDGGNRATVVLELDASPRPIRASRRWRRCAR